MVSSGAIGLGAKALSHTSPVVHIAMRQACAAIGQPILMSAYQEEFSKHNLISSQVLITRSVLNNRTSFKNLRSSVSTLLALGVIPIFNENDAVSTSEIGNVFGDNDRMSALVASKIDAELLIPTYGYCQIPPCQDFTQDVCTGFFDLPLYPAQQSVNSPTQCNL